MSTDSLSDLLPLTPGVVRPTAFDILGIPPTDDAGKIELAIESVLANLKSKQASADPQTFSRAVGLVRKAKQILDDPQRRRRLVDEAAAKRSATTNRTGASPNPVSHGTASSPSEAAPAGEPDDPLAGILPPVDPLAGILPAVEDTDPAGEAVAQTNTGTSTSAVATDTPVERASVDRPSAPPPVAAAPVQPGASSLPEATVAPPTPVASPAPIVRKSTRRRRRGPSLMSCAMILAVFGLLAIVGGLAFVLVLKPDGFAVSRGSDGITVGMSPPGDRPEVSAPAAVRSGGDGSPRPKDPIMRPPPPRSGASSGLDGMVDPGPPMIDPSTMDGDAGNTTTSDPPMDDAMSDSMASPSPAMDTESAVTNPPSPAMDGSMSPSSPSLASEVEIAAAAAAIDNVRQAIHTRQWDQMKSLAEAVREQPMTPDQSETIEALYVLADLASYYRGGIRRGLADQEATRDFEVVPGFRVIIVEVSEDSIAVQFNRQTKRFALDDLPTVIADRLATFSIPEGSTRTTAAAVYHALTAEATDTIESELNFLRSLDEMINEVSTDQLADEMAMLVSQSGSP